MAQLSSDPSGRRIDVSFWQDSAEQSSLLAGDRDQSAEADQRAAAGAKAGEGAQDGTEPEDSSQMGAKRAADGNSSSPRPLVWSEAVQALQGDDPAFRQLLARVLHDVPHEAYFWECPPVSAATAGRRRFEFVLLEAGPLRHLNADTGPFAEHLDRYRGQEVARTFANLGGDSRLVAPAWAVEEDPEAYAHAGRFFRRAPLAQRLALLKELGHAIDKRLAEVSPETPLWVSTEGSGVYWLHVRLDPRPKYYHHSAYRDPNYGREEL